MTNNWTDLGNATLFIVMGANPAENHPASIAHVNRAREDLVGGVKTIYDRAGNAYTSSKPKAEMIVIDPRKTRTAAMADKYIRIRPGTDIAFINAMINYITDATGTGTGFNDPANSNKKTRWEAYHQATLAKATSIYNDANAKQNPVRPKYTDATFNVSTTDYVRDTHVSALGTFTGLPTVAGTALDFTGTPDMYAAGTAFSALKAHVAPYTLAESADICGCTADEIKYVADKMIANSRCSSVATDAAAFAATINDPRTANYRSTTFMYAMGITQHTCGSQNVKSFAVIQTLMGNMGRAGGGINALRGIHNVQGSTDMGLLYHLIPGYSGNPTGDFGHYMNSLYGNRLNGVAGGTAAIDPYVFASGGLQQKGFWSMTKTYFGDTPYRLNTGSFVGYTEPLSVLPEDAATMDALYSLWPKGNGDNHVKMFRKMQSSWAGTDKIRAAVVWGQNPAVTEPNQGAVRSGLKELDLLVCVDMFENETAACDRKDDSRTYLIPASSHVEEAGSATNSGRVLQWRYQNIAPQGKSKTDIELLMRFAFALNGAGAFDHIKAVWAGATINQPTWDPYTKLWAEQYGWTPGGTFDCEASAEKCYKQMCAPQNNGGALWLYLEGWDSVTTTRGGGWPAGAPNRAKSRINVDADGVGFDNGGGHLLYKNWGYAWLVNRRVLYTNGDTPWDVSDGFQGPDLVARLFVSTKSDVVEYSTAYRKVHTLADKPQLPGGATPDGSSFAGRFPWHTEPYETPRDDVAGVYGYNSSSSQMSDRAAGAEGNLIFSDSPRGTKETYPLVLTTIRCVEHFQGGPITRNNHWNVEMEPEPWIELNSVDARAFSIKDGDMVRIVTARTDGFAGDTIASTYPRAAYGDGFRARVGVGVKDNQRVGVGVVAIPWHWGDRGLSTGSRANDLCLDAMDANSTIPEYKACLCRIEKI
ncbi:MAG: hypothetical protein CVT67_09575 [Actinobacteria bacterium HGW-Actinobacteria-7]|nr:MAG: hypothetical protein CVT67_09575 [Actinobacteria bacterium HGW-Actinobacteria-7]